ncbi:hypothetical protein CYY_010322 [Polysphondylium violaceum]|uniref:Uncharacterized protein n=1 Tax=Polysphondylium violaceum TaxID=133409 RepID=A0A8J4UTY2_9MYCE|nr:hypothetical protein CYY_010322 [Polysphondylium violaceum]
MSIAEIKNLKKVETVYFFYYNNCVNTNQISITFNDGVVDRTIDYAKDPNSKLLIVAHNDAMGISSMKFTLNSGTFCSKLSIDNLFTSRKYEMELVGNQYKIIKYNPNNLEFTSWCDANVFLQIEILGSIKRHSFFMETDTWTKSLDNVPYLGDIKAIRVRAFGAQTQCHKFRIVQTCPEGQSKCLPKNTPYRPLQGYRKTLDSKLENMKIIQQYLYIPFYPYGQVQF